MDSHTITKHIVENGSLDAQSEEVKQCIDNSLSRINENQTQPITSLDQTQSYESHLDEKSLEKTSSTHYDTYDSIESLEAALDTEQSCESCRKNSINVKHYNSIFYNEGKYMCKTCAYYECCSVCLWEAGGDICRYCRSIN